MRFLHTSDWHLGRIFHGLHMTDDQAIVPRRTADTGSDPAGRGSAPFSPGGRQKCHYDRRQSR